MQNKIYKIIISGGGTGGHIFPAIAVAEALKKKLVNPEILFVGAKGKMEMEKVPLAGYSIEGLYISGFQRKLTYKNLFFPFKLIASLIKARRIIHKFKPDVAIGFGGYASGPILKAANQAGIPTFIWEGNSYAGITNKILAKSVRKIFVAYQGMEIFFPQEKIVLSGNPIRKEVSELEGKKSSAQEYFSLNMDERVLLIIGGSLGARTINQCVMANIDLFNKNNISIIWQTGRLYYKSVLEAVKEKNMQNIKVFDFISKMDFAYAVADVVISRAGAISISELCNTGKAAILIPSPNVAEDHQTKNAKALADLNAAILIKDSEAVEKIGETVVNLFDNCNLILEIQQNIKKLAFPDSADKIAEEVTKILK